MTWIDRGKQLISQKQSLRMFIIFEDYTYKEGEILIDEYGRVCAELEYINQMALFESIQKTGIKPLKIESKL